MISLISLNAQKKTTQVKRRNPKKQENTCCCGIMYNQVPCVDFISKFLNTVDVPPVGEVQNDISSKMLGKENTVKCDKPPCMNGDFFCT